jgi:hypothetical protein
VREDRVGLRSKDPAMLKEFREFVLRGNLVDLAVAVVIGTAFTAVVTSLVKNLITPLIAAVDAAHAAAGGRGDTPVPKCLSEIPIAARRCAFCTTQVAAAR